MGRTCVAGTNQVSVDSYGATLFGMKRHRPRLREARRRAGPRRRRPAASSPSRRGARDGGASVPIARPRRPPVPASRSSSPSWRCSSCCSRSPCGRLGSVALGVFLGADPLIALNSAVNGVWLWPGWLALAMLVLPLVAGRAFCGYVCPTGTLIETTTPSRGTRQALAHRARPAARAADLRADRLARAAALREWRVPVLRPACHTHAHGDHPALPAARPAASGCSATSRYLAAPLRTGIDLADRSPHRAARVRHGRSSTASSWR